jgi:cytochrome c oxidase assembly protein subunit 15
LFFYVPWWRNFFENVLMVQFVHRSVAYVLLIAAVAHAIDARRTARGGVALAAALILQAALGIATLIYQAPIALALMHQAMAIIVLTVAVVHAERVTLRTREAPAGEPLAGRA